MQLSEEEKAYMKYCEYDEEPKKVILNLVRELQLKDKVIYEMASYIGAYELDDDIVNTYCDGTYENCKHKEDIGTCNKCITEYFINKVKGE